MAATSKFRFHAEDEGLLAGEARFEEPPGGVPQYSHLCNPEHSLCVASDRPISADLPPRILSFQVPGCRLRPLPPLPARLGPLLQAPECCSRSGPSLIARCVGCVSTTRSQEYPGQSPPMHQWHRL